jgi:DNA-binding winged helix-turn-helix (wHTH) protein
MDLKSLKGYQFGPFRLDLGKGYLYREDGVEVELKPTSKSILEYMLENTLDEGGTLFKRGQIFDAVWGSEAVEDGALDKQIAELRKAFGRGERDQSVIETKPREGYRFKLPVTKIYAEARSESTAEVALEQQRPLADTFGLWLLSRRGLIILLPLAVLVGATIAASIFYRECPTRAQTIASVGQCVIILLLFVHSLRNRPKGLLSKQSPAEVTNAGYSVVEFVTEQPILQKRLELFTNWWSAMLVSWVPLYFFYAWETWGIDCTASSTNTLASILEAAFNIANTAIIILCYDLLNKEPGRQLKNRLFTGPAEIGLVLLPVIPLLSLLRVLTAEQGLAAFTLLTGLYAGIYMALFVARLQSKFLDPSPLLVVLLFSYTAIQPLALYIQTRKEWAWAVLDYALVLKCLLYLYVFWLIESGDLLFYFREVKRNYDDRVDQRRRAHRRLIQ